VRDPLPSILSLDEVARLINASGNLFRRALWMTLYGTGMRRSEVAHLKLSIARSARPTYGLLRDSCRLVHEMESVHTIWRLAGSAVKEKCMKIAGCLILRDGQTGDHNIRVVRKAQTIRPVS
jgi:hypothetical protein